MASITLQALVPISVEGLGTDTFTVLVAGPHKFSIRSTMDPTSNLSIVINQNGSPIATSPTISTLEQELQLEAKAYCAVSDVITFVLSSTGAPNDITPNNVKSLITIEIL